jgi:hypothetical protein
MSLPFELRLRGLAATKSDVLAAMERIFAEEIARVTRWLAGIAGAETRRQARSAALSDSGKSPYFNRVTNLAHSGSPVCSLDTQRAFEYNMSCHFHRIARNCQSNARWKEASAAIEVPLASGA